MQPINKNWNTPDGIHDGGVSTGIGFTIAWQRGAVVGGSRNGAFSIEVLEACLDQLRFHQSGKFACAENADAIAHIEAALTALNQRLERRHSEGILGQHQPD